MVATRLERTFFAIGWFLTIISIWMLWRQGVARSYFHQDDVVELGVIAMGKWPDTLLHLNNEHLNITFWPLLYLQWILFGIDYLPYLSLNIILHVLVLILMFRVTYKITGSLLWSSLPVWGMVINANWFTVVWWITGQMFFLTTIFALLSYEVIIRKKNLVWLFLYSVLPGLSWGVGLTWPTWPLLVFGIDYAKKKINKIGLTLLASQITLAGIYFSIIGKNLAVHTDPRTWLTNPLEVLKFVIVGISNTVVGRWLWPTEQFRTRILVLFLALFPLMFAWKYRRLVNRRIVFGIVVVMGSFLTFAIPRWRFGIGHAMANYYAYFPLPFLLISLSVFWNRMKMKSVTRFLIMAVFLIHIPMSWMGFEEWAGEWVYRPQQTKAYFQELNSTKVGDCLENRFIPEYIVPQNIWRIDYLWPILKKDFSPFCDLTR